MTNRVPASWHAAIAPLLLLIVAAVGAAPYMIAYAQNCGCRAPRISNGASLKRVMKVVAAADIATTVTPSMIQAAGDYWNSAFQSAGVTDKGYTSNGTWDDKDIGIIKDVNLEPPAQIFFDNDGVGTMHIRPDVFTNATWLNALLKHELGHPTGYDNLTQAGCGTQDSMLVAPGPLSGSGPSTPTCNDLAMIAGVYTPPPVDNDHDGWDAANDCDDGDFNKRSPSIGDPPPCGHTGDWNCNGTADETECASPVVVDVLGNGIDLTDNAAGVQFDFDGDGSPEQVSWTAVGSDDAWLVLDRNGNGLIDSGAELFGNWTPQPSSSGWNGFSALAVFDGPTVGGNANGWFDPGDRYFDQVRLWRDSSHDGVSQSDELVTLRSVGLKRISLAYVESRRRDQWGNWFRYRARVVDERSADVGQFAYDVFLLTTPGRIRPAPKPR